MLVATLIAADALTDEMVFAARTALADAGLLVIDQTQLDFRSATDLSFSGDIEAACDALAPFMGEMDIVVQPVTGRRKSLIIADMDSTMITVECIDELADYAGIKPQIAAITERAMRGELDFQAALRLRVGLLGGLDAAVIDRCLAERVALMPGARALVQTMKAFGARAVLVSGGFTRFAQPVAGEIGFDHAIANVLDIADGQLTGKVVMPIVDSATKLATLEAECAALGIEPSAVLAVGDGANDIPMLVAAGLGVAFRAHPAAQAAADAAIRHNDLTALLWAQGISRRDWKS